MHRKLLLIVWSLLLILSGCSISVGTGSLTITPVVEPVAIQPVAPNYDDYWMAMRHFDFDYVDRNEVGTEYREFTRGLRLLMDDETAEAETLFMTLFESTEDTLLRWHSAEILQVIYTRQDKWNELVALNAHAPRGFDENNTVIMAAAFATAQPEKYHFPEKPVVLPTKLSISGTPMVEVTVNGVRKRFWIDTGAEMTVLSSDFAEECGVNVIGTEAAKVGTSTDIMIDMKPGVIKDFRVGDLQIENHPVIILEKKDLEVRLFKLIRIVKLDGIIGWNAIRNLEMILDYKNLTTTIRQPEKHPYNVRNFHFVVQPIVSLTDTLGKPLYFFLDTGANSTSLFEPALLKIDTTKAKSGKAFVGGAGGTQRYQTTEIPELSIILGQHRLNFQKLSSHGNGENGFFYLDGMLGSDVAKNGALILDFQNGRCDLKMPE